MNEERHGIKSNQWLTWFGPSALLIVLAVLTLVISRSGRRAVITIDANGTARLGVIPLQNQKVRYVTLKALARIQPGTGSVVVASSANYSNVIRMLRAMHNAGITNCAFRSEPPGSISSIYELRRRQSENDAHHE